MVKAFTYYFWTFILGSILGVIVETVWCMIRYKKIESRKGLVFGPFNPLYGFAALCISLSINCVTRRRLGNIFLIGTVVASTIEYLCSYYQEKITGTVSWDYKNFRWNLNGRINLVYSIFWGALTVLWYNEFMPLVDGFVGFVEDKPWITIAMVVFMIVDCAISLAACIRRKERRKNIAAKSKFDERIDIVYNDDVMKKIYPNSEFVD